MDLEKIKTFGELKKAGYEPKSIKEELRRNLLQKIIKKVNLKLPKTEKQK